MQKLKQTLREELQQRRDALDRREERSAAICAHVAALPAFQVARVVHCFVPMRSEVDVLPLLAGALAAGKGVIVPLVVRGAAELQHTWIDSLDDEAWQAAGFGTRQPRHIRPAQPGDWDITIVPLLAFDRRGYRLGYGKGYYDRLLAATSVPAVGVAFAAQEVPLLPSEPHDMRLDYVVTEDEVLDVEREA
jgi:5-formyltetrahydrofolate cyclo-ligase